MAPRNIINDFISTRLFGNECKCLWEANFVAHAAHWRMATQYILIYFVYIICVCACKRMRDRKLDMRSGTFSLFRRSCERTREEPMPQKKKKKSRFWGDLLQASDAPCIYISVCDHVRTDAPNISRTLKYWTKYHRCHAAGIWWCSDNPTEVYFPVGSFMHDFWEVCPSSHIRMSVCSEGSDWCASPCPRRTCMIDTKNTCIKPAKYLKKCMYRVYASNSFFLLIVAPVTAVLFRPC